MVRIRITLLQIVVVVIFFFNVSVCGENEKFLVSACDVVLVVQGKHRSINSNQLKIVSNTPI